MGPRPKADFTRYIRQELPLLAFAPIVVLSALRMHDVWRHAQLHARNRFTEVMTPGGPVAALWPPALPASFEPRMDAVPAVGQHTDALLCELGFDSDTIAGFRHSGVV